MDTRDRHLALAVARHLCLGAQIGGVRFGPVLQVLLTDSAQIGPHRGQTYLNLGSRWIMYVAPPERLPTREAALPERSVEDRLHALCAIREQTIVDVTLGETEPHLLLTLDSGRSLYAIGYHPQYECWQLGIAFAQPLWMLVVCPGGGVAVWCPDEFAKVAVDI